MRAESTGADAKPVADARGPEGLRSTGFSQFLSRIFEQLSISAWLPAAMLVGNVALLLQLSTYHKYHIELAIKQIGQSLGTIIILVFAVVLATMVTQAFAFDLIRLLEGYIDSPRRWLQELMAMRIRRHKAKRSKLDAKLDRATKDAFKQAKKTMLEIPDAYDAMVLELLEHQLFGSEPDLPPSEELQESVDATDWRLHLPPEVLYRIDSMDARLASYPAAHRLLPTRLGNVLRASEDNLERQTEENLEGFVIRHYDELPASLKDEHDDYRTRLDMYCCLVLVFSALAAVGGISLLRVHPAWGAAVAAGAYIALAGVSYEAAIASARRYGRILQEIGQYLNNRGERADASVPSALARLLQVFGHRDPMSGAIRNARSQP
jgi:hypothetical protein